MPEYRFQDSDIKDGKVRLANLIVACGCAASTSEARRLIQGGGVTFEGEKIESVDHELPSDAAGVLKVGKRRFVKIVK
jgi:tyrosyl-tRNA synthetase